MGRELKHAGKKQAITQDHKQIPYRNNSTTKRQCHDYTTASFE